MKSQYSLSSEEIDELVAIAFSMYSSPINPDILNALLKMVYDMLEQHNRIFAIRTDLRKVRTSS